MEMDFHVHFADLILFNFQCVYIKWTQTNIIHYSKCISLTSERIFMFQEVFEICFRA